MTKSKIDIINFALQQLKIDPLNSLAEISKESQEMQANYQIAKEYSRSSFVYDWAHATTPLTAYQDKDGGYIEPSNVVSIIGLGTSSQLGCCANSFKNLNNYSHQFSIRKVNGRLYIDSCCLADYGVLHYMKDETNYNTIPSDLFKLIGFELALISSQALSKSESITAFLQNMIGVLKKEAQQYEGMRYKQQTRSLVRRYPFGDDWTNGVYAYNWF
jgi:hypothetical protein